MARQRVDPRDHLPRAAGRLAPFEGERRVRARGAEEEHVVPLQHGVVRGRAVLRPDGPAVERLERPVPALHVREAA